MSLLVALFVLATACSPDTTAPRRTPGRDGGEGPAAPDADGDGISDAHEGRADGVDSDGDGTPDYLDDDSDGDGIGDATEGGTRVSGDVPLDTDGDGTPDFRDLDADGNGIPDSVEGSGDSDSDGQPDFRDGDNDGDFLPDGLEIGDDLASPVEHDGDGVADYLDLDSDNDAIGDRDESTPDTDGDGRPDRHDSDSDNDEWPDADEAGDTDVSTTPVDTDRDGTPDFRDPDSDGDGLSDLDERRRGTSRTAADTDGDGVSDLIEVAACPDGDATCASDATDGSRSPRTRGDFVFVVPYMEPPDPERDTLQFSTSLQKADVYFLMDNTGSMGGTVRALQMGLTSVVIPDIRARIPEAWFGVGGFDDYPFSPYGGPCRTDAIGLMHDLAFFQYQTMTGDDVMAQNAVNRYQVNCGGDLPESGIAALFSLMTRDTLGGHARFPGTSPPDCPAGHVGAACFRPDAVPIIVVMTDVDQHNRPACGCDYDTRVPGRGPSWAAMIAAMTERNARAVGIATAASADGFLNQLVTETTIARGAPGPASMYVLSAPGGTGLTAAVTTAVQRAAQVPLDVSARAVDVVDPGETVDAVRAFIDHLETRTMPAPGLECTTGFVVVDRDGIDDDVYPDTHQDVTPGAPVCFDIIARRNETVMPLLVPQLFRARIDVIGDGFTPLDSRDVYFLVPPRIEIPQGPG
ncbi:MAG: hypothetical protein NZ898_10510 [Myxococcota bacterium]|nr:hypothetical protein [Myxococcota bacterium]MDW8363406.1 hypothetical protein [Myxococcales bacterium]